MSTPEEKRSPQYQMRLLAEFRAQLEEQARKDGDASLATWIKGYCVKSYAKEALNLKVSGIIKTDRLTDWPWELFRSIKQPEKNGLFAFVKQ